MKKISITAFLLFLAIYNYAQYSPSKKQDIGNKSIANTAIKHKQLYNMSCIPMSIEMILKYNDRVSPNYYDLQNIWKDKSDGTFANFDGKTIAGLKFKHQFNIKRGDDFPIDRLFKAIDNELSAGRKVIVSLPTGSNLWHMYVIDRKMEQDDYLAYSKGFNNDQLLTLEYVKRWIRGCKGTDILTYKSVN